ncbi:hypothetical protein Bca4012_025732 [Brassica carinata]|uniref:Uncharacterized protein n=1 Tax=Brassica carinata TaxID=52824 RepID=A0A8X7VH56_BRACI|nr:hypothetical protein Bca52824_022857 [Brassica carinata]
MVPIYSVWPLSDSVSRLVHCSEVTRCNQSFRMTASLLAIRFSDSTTFDELTGPLTPIPKRLIPLSHLSHSPTEPREAIMVVEEQPPQQQTPYLDDQIIEEAAEAVNVSPTARSLATAEVVAKASVSGEQRMVRRAAQKPVDDRLFMWAVVGITIATVVLLLKNFIRSSRFMEES